MIPPTWPALMRRKTAATYLDMSEASFERQIAQGVFPGAVRIGRVAYWRKDAIDAAVARLSGAESDMPDYEKEFWSRGQAA